MFRYIIRRMLYMIPTVFGVIVVIFVLFNVAGGDPAMVKLGKKASPKALEDFDAQRGYNKPLIAGLWGRTRAYEETGFEADAGPWRRVNGALYTNGTVGRISLPEGGTYAVPLSFGLHPAERYRWQVGYRLPADGRAAFVIGDGTNTARAAALEASGSWEQAAVVFDTGADTSSLKCEFVVEKGALEVSRLALGRRGRHWFDSQLWFYLKQLARLDFGTSQETNQRVARMIADGILPSLALTVPMFFIGVAVSVALALVCAYFRNMFIDRFLVVFAVVLMSVNYLVWIIFGQHILAYGARLFPIWGFESWKYLVLPCVVGVVSGLGGSLRFYRTVMLDEMYKDYVRTALAKGVSRSGVLFRHVLKNAMIPILTNVVMAIPFLYTGSLLLESFFGIPGLGRMGVNGINSSDFDVIRALFFVEAVLYVIASLCTDICYALVDPRVRLK